MGGMLRNLKVTVPQFVADWISISKGTGINHNALLIWKI